MKPFSGYIMSGDIKVAVIENNEVRSYNSLAPTYIKNYGNFVNWLKIRSIDTHRTNSRLLRKILRLRTAEEESISMSVYGVTITDNYWVKEKGSLLKYKDVVFKDDLFSDLALKGDTYLFSCSVPRDSLTPELTNIGSYEKCWKYHNGMWVLYKTGTDYEKFSELFVCFLGKELGFNMADYIVKDGFILSKDFTNRSSDKVGKNINMNFQPAYSYVLDDDDYIENIKALKLIDNSNEYDSNKSNKYNNLIQQYMDILFLDTVVMNVDRHTFNYGLLTDSSTGDILSLAPNFDNNIALIYKGYPKSTKRSGMFVDLFKEALDYYSYSIPHLAEKHLYVAYNNAQSFFNTKFDKDFIMEFCYNGYKEIIK